MSDFNGEAGSWCSSVTYTDDDSVDNDYYFRITHGGGNSGRRPSILRASANSAVDPFETVRCPDQDAPSYLKPQRPKSSCLNGTSLHQRQASPTSVALHDLLWGGSFPPSEAHAISSPSSLSPSIPQESEHTEKEESDDDCTPFKDLSLDDLSLYFDDDDAEPIAYKPSFKIVSFVKNVSIPAEEKALSKIEMFWHNVTKCFPQRPKQPEKLDESRPSNFQEMRNCFSFPTVFQAQNNTAIDSLMSVK